ncbi:hypothetical protein VNI00_016820 [Paramarasmius palmivorus]|uniref:Peptidase S33 tripeptidyl aminopeptidase-like C-terminal domain-containing protein n=1 Tax=Paramarasmius palmivorus TaxID=297713 RepID=A0AAW0BD58_9AGAR
MTPRSRGLRLVSALLFSLGGVLAHCLETEGWSELSWASIEPTKELAWRPCYDTVGSFECGRLQVPLNYSDPDGQSAAIALIRIKANVSSDSPEYRGPVLYNPGGPGGSGVDDLLVYGKRLAKTVGPEFDILSFDPRGQNSSSQYVSNIWARSKIEGILAEERLADVLPHIQTDHTARDMLRINEAHGREKIQYWGISYFFQDTATVLGATFAAMFPDKVERLVIDGVVDVANDYYTAQWREMLLDADKALQWFFKDCHAAGPELCAFYDESPEAIRSQTEQTASLEISDWAEMAAAARISCSHWPKIPKTFFRGPISGNTSHPILLIGNSADPATPLHAAQVVSQGFPGSVVLTQDYAGHASISAPSFCTENALRAYFLNGTLPEPGTVCPVEGTAFTNPTPLSQGAGEGNALKA